MFCLYICCLLHLTLIVLCIVATEAATVTLILQYKPVQVPHHIIMFFADQITYKASIIFSHVLKSLTKQIYTIRYNNFASQS